MIEPDDTYCPEGVPADAWGDYQWLLSRADYGVMESHHLQQLQALRQQYPQLRTDPFARSSR